MMDIIPDISKRNHLAQDTGQRGESLAQIILKKEFPNANVVFVDDISDYLIGGTTPLEVKTCHQWVTSRYNSTGRRRGCFELVEEQHKYLKDNYGLYIFIVLSTPTLEEWGDLISDYFYRIVDARFVPFNRWINWKKIWAYPVYFKTMDVKI